MEWVFVADFALSWWLLGMGVCGRFALSCWLRGMGVCGGRCAQSCLAPLNGCWWSILP